MYQNPIYGMFDLNYIQAQLQRQYHADQMRKSFDCARKFDDFLESVADIAPEYQQVACAECCAVIGKYLHQYSITL